MATVSHSTPELVALMQQAMAARDFNAAERVAEIISVLEPAQEDAIGFLVARAIDRREIPRARDVALGAVHARPDSAKLQFHFGVALQAAGEHSTALLAFQAAHVVDPALLPALLWQAECKLALGRYSEALRSQLSALYEVERSGLLARPGSLQPPVRERIERAYADMHRARKLALEPALAPLREQHGAAAIERIDRAIARVYGEPAPQPKHPLQRPHLLYVPDLADQAWFEREQLPYLETLEAATEVIREELLAVLSDEPNLMPRVDRPKPAAVEPIWRKLSHPPAWSEYSLYRHGRRVESNCSRCPRTLAMLESLPLVRIADHAPEIRFCVLKPHTHVAQHTGVINGRLSVQLPLIVPKNCGVLRVGYEAREWNEGQSQIFDDSFVHEAWNTSDHTCIVLSLGVWNPHLSEPEREALSIAIAELGEFHRRYGGGDLTHED
jgi:aspartate beta-hydroxylase